MFKFPGQQDKFSRSGEDWTPATAGRLISVRGARPL